MPLNETGKELLGDPTPVERAARSVPHDSLTVPERKPRQQPVEEYTAERFPNDVARHELAVFLDQEAYRHIRFRNPASSNYFFDLVTWPGHLAVSGDMGVYVFQRDYDMFAFFRSNPDRPKYRINPQYWGSKLVAGESPVRFSAERWRDEMERQVQEYIANKLDERGDELEVERLRAELREALYYAGLLNDAVDEQEAFDLLYHFEYEDFGFETWDLDVHEFDFRFLWILHAIVWGIEQYDRSTA